MSVNNMRELPRYIEERKMIGTMPAKTFLKLLPFYIILGLIAFKFANPFLMFVCFFTILILYLLFSEISRNYTVLNLLNDYLRYRREGNQYFERSSAHEPEYKKVTFVEIKRPWFKE